jgi:hypothetical protein
MPGSAMSSFDWTAGAPSAGLDGDDVWAHASGAASVSPTPMVDPTAPWSVRARRLTRAMCLRNERRPMSASRADEMAGLARVGRWNRELASGAALR